MSPSSSTLIVRIDKALLSERVGKLPHSNLQLVLAGIDTVLGRYLARTGTLGPRLLASATGHHGTDILTS